MNRYQVSWGDNLIDVSAESALEAHKKAMEQQHLLPATHLSVLLLEKDMPTPLTNAKSGSIMSTETKEEIKDENDSRPQTGLPAQRRDVESESAGLRKDVQTESIPRSQEVGRVGDVDTEQGGRSEGVRGEVDSGGDDGGGSLESGNSTRDYGERQRLENPPSRHDVILDSHSDIGATAGAASRFDANLDAIRTIQKLDKEKRQATPDEQAILTKYSGFGDSAFEQLAAYSSDELAAVLATIERIRNDSGGDSGGTGAAGEVGGA